MKLVTSEELVAFVRKRNEKELRTIRRNKAFLANAVLDNLSFLPFGGSIREETPKRIKRICERFNRIRSFKTSDYIDVTVSASYLLAVIKAYLDAHKLREDNSAKTRCIVIFHYRIQLNAHDLFQAWRKTNPSGFFLNRKSPVILHQSTCPHLGDTKWKAGLENWDSLTVSAKVCARTVSELESWASEHEVKFCRCKDCKPDPSSPAILSEEEYEKRLAAILLDAKNVFLEEEFKDVPPGRIEVKQQRIIRDTKMSNYVKVIHRHRCQLCDTTIELRNGVHYSEGHHVRPLGGEHKGPDQPSNLLCVCPNCHVVLDNRAIKLQLDELRSHPKHRVDPKHVEYHNRLVDALAR